MTFNPIKCEFLRITNKINIIPFTYHIDNSTIREVTHAKYLGVVIDQHLNWNEHTKQVASKAIRINAFLHRYLYQCPPTINVIFIKQWFALLWSMLPQSGTHTHVLTLIN